MDCLKASSLRKISWEQNQVGSSRACTKRLRRMPKRIEFTHHRSTCLDNHIQAVKIASPISQQTLRYPSSRVFSAYVGLEEGNSLALPEEQSSVDVEEVSDGASETGQPQKLSSEELKALLLDSERSRLLKKLSEANQSNRFLKRQLHTKDDDLINFKFALAVLELELQTLVDLAKEIANSSIDPGTRKINGKYIQSHLFSRLEAVHEKVKEQIKDVAKVEVQEVNLSWVGMAESVQVMGSFDGWNDGEELSPEYDGGYTRFSTKLMLRPGRYEIKFVVDGVWQLSPEFPTTGEGLLENNLLVVE